MIRYDTKEEIEKTGEWLARINESDCAEELEYVPSELWKLGVAPEDVADRLPWLRRATKQDTKVVTIRATATVPTPPATVEVEQPIEEQEAPVEDVLDAPLDEEAVEPLALVLDYDQYGPWEWAAPIEKMVEDAIMAVFDHAPDLPVFNSSAFAVKPLDGSRRRGKSARATTFVAELPLQRVDELVSTSGASS